LIFINKNAQIHKAVLILASPGCRAGLPVRLLGMRVRIPPTGSMDVCLF